MVDAATLDMLGREVVRPPFLAWLDFSPLGLDDPAQFFLDHAQVMLSPGEIFDPSCRGWVRLNMGTSRERLERIIEAMGTAWTDHRT